MELDIFKSGEYKVIKIKGELRLRNIEKFNKIALEEIAGSTEKFIIDLDDVSILDSSGFGALMVFQKKLSRRKQGLGLANVGENIRKILDLISLLESFRFFKGNKKDSYKIISK